MKRVSKIVVLVLISVCILAVSEKRKTKYGNAVVDVRGREGIAILADNIGVANSCFYSFGLNKDDKYFEEAVMVKSFFVGDRIGKALSYVGDIDKNGKIDFFVSYTPYSRDGYHAVDYPESWEIAVDAVKDVSKRTSWKSDKLFFIHEEMITRGPDAGMARIWYHWAFTSDCRKCSGRSCLRIKKNVTDEELKKKMREKGGY